MTERLDGLVADAHRLIRERDRIAFGPTRSMRQTEPGRPTVERGRRTEDLTEPPALPALHPAALHGPAGEFVRALEPHTEADPAALLVQTLVGYGSCAGRSAHVRVGADRHSPNLFALLVGGTSRGRKGLAWAEAGRLLGELDLGWHTERVQSGLSSGEGLIWAVRDPTEREDPIKEKGRVVEYQAVRSDPGVKDKRLLIVESEFAATLKVAAREGNILSAVVRQAWDNGTLRVLSKNNPARATDAHISIIGHITAEELRRQLASTEMANGFANRFLFVFVRRSKLLPEGGGPVDLGAVVPRFRDALRFAHGAGSLARTSDGRELWCRAYPLLTTPRPGLLGAATGRAEAQVLRLSLVYALLDCAPAIDWEHVAAAIALWNYCADSAAYVLGNALGNPMADELLAALRGADEGLTRTELRDHFSRHQQEAVTLALGMLQELGLAEASAVSSGGRPRQVWRATKATEVGKHSLLSLLSQTP